MREKTELPDGIGIEEILHELVLQQKRQAVALERQADEMERQTEKLEEIRRGCNTGDLPELIGVLEHRLKTDSPDFDIYTEGGL